MSSHRALPNAFWDNLKVEITAKLATTQSLLDKLDTTAWDARDLEIFDTLVAEKRQSEKDHHQMTSGGRRGRQLVPADLKAAAGDWRYDLETAGYIFVGKRPCAIDRSSDQQCHHEICKEAKSKEGVSYMEYDTIIHYSQRIANAKSARMQSALQKQRDVQLAKDKEAGQEWKEKAIKKFKYLGKDACDALLAVAQQFDKTLTLPLVAPPDKPDTAVEQVGRALSKLRIQAMTPENAKFLESLHGLLLTPDATRDSDALHWRDATEFYEYIKNVEYAHLDGSIMNLRHALALNALMPYELDCGIRLLLEELKGLMQHLDRGIRTKPGLTIQGGLRAILKKLKNENIVDEAFQDLPRKGHLFYASRQCAIVASIVRENMLKVADANPVLTGRNLHNALQTARNDANSRSPFPSLTMEHSELDFQRCRQRGLIHHIVDTLNATKKEEVDKANEQKAQLHNRLITILTEDLTDHESSTYETNVKLRAKVLLNFEKNRDYQEAAEAIHAAEHAVSKVVADHRQKEQISEENIEKKIQAVSASLLKPTFTIQRLPGVKTEDSEAIILKYARAFYSKQKLHLVVQMFLPRGACEFFLAFQTIGICDQSFPDASYVEASEVEILTGDLQLHLKNFTRTGEGIEDYLRGRYLDGWCLAKIMVRLTVIVSHLSAYNRQCARSVLRNMALLVESDTAALPANWLRCFRVIAEGILKTYGYLMLEATRVFGRADVDQFVLSCIWILLLHAVVAKSAFNGVSQFIRAWNFVQEVLDISTNQLWIKHVKDLFEDIIDFSEIRCDDARKCGSKAERLGRAIHAPRSQYEILSTAPRSINITSHCHTLVTIVNSKDFQVLTAARVLKYIAIRVSEALGPELTIQDLECLWYVFVKVEAKITGKTHSLLDALDASSMCLYMHNGCNIWELFASEERASAFFEGYNLGYRSITDMERLFRSLILYAFSYGSKTRTTRKIQRLFVPLIYGGPLFGLFNQYVKDLRTLFMECATESTPWRLTAQTSVNRLDHLIIAGEDIRRVEYLKALQRYCRLAFGNDAEISRLTTSTLKDVENGLVFLPGDPRSDLMADFWKDAEVQHIDIIYSEDETDTDLEGDDFNPFVLRPLDDLEGRSESESGGSSISETSVYELQKAAQPPSDDLVESPGLLMNKLRLVPGSINPILSTANTTTHTRNRSTITIETPETVCRGRGILVEPLSTRSVRDRSPTPFPRLPNSLSASRGSLTNPETYRTKPQSPSAMNFVDETTIPELLVDISDEDDSGLDDFSPFESPPEECNPIFYTILTKSSTLLDQLQNLQSNMAEIKRAITYSDHPLRAMFTSEDNEEKRRTTEMFDKVTHLEQQMHKFQESLGVLDYIRDGPSEKEKIARLVVERETGNAATEEESSSEEDDSEESDDDGPVGHDRTFGERTVCDGLEN